MNLTFHDLPEKLRQIRLLCGFSQEAIATSLAMSQTALSRLEAGNAKLTIEFVDQIAQFYKLTIAELIYDDLATIAHKLIDRKVIVTKVRGGKHRWRMIAVDRDSTELGPKRNAIFRLGPRFIQNLTLPATERQWQCLYPRRSCPA